MFPTIRNPQSAICNQISRRELMRLSAAGVAGASLSGWLGLLAQHAARAAAPPARPKSCILLWMNGGPSHHDTFDPKPDAADDIRGDLKAIATSVPGIQICEKFPRFAQQLKHAALLRGMTSDEGDHGRARYYVHTGYKPGFGGLRYPLLGSMVSAELGRPEFPLPNYVVTSGAPAGKFSFLTDAGYRGSRHVPLVLNTPNQGLENLNSTVPADDFDDRAGVLDKLEQGFARTTQADAASAHATTFRRALELMRSDKSKAFDLALEPESSRRPYGESKFGQGCLLARRLVEAGVSFVEVYQSDWDTHNKAASDAALGLMTQVDEGMSALVTDLKERGLLDTTLIIWMGEFGRTPKIGLGKNVGGRDHWPKAWSTVMVGGGIRGGQVIGKTDAIGGAVVDRPISIKDFMASVCTVLGIDHRKKAEAPGGRPVHIVDAGAQPIRELVR
ncbi:hypothetical protein AYO44_13910 [Planctomycetaceae bacterium SCGC AG-212-F19]|nr:hypothetical protein AYO44_13910 [Planctomycetaceae bacterium SCGC AG-212-F19]